MSFTVSCISHFYHTLVPPLEDDPPFSASMKEQYFFHPGVQKNGLKSKIHLLLLDSLIFMQQIHVRVPEINHHSKVSVL